MPEFKDLTAPGQKYDKSQKLSELVYSVADYLPRLDIVGFAIVDDGDLNESNSGTPFQINGFNAGWDRFNKIFRPIEKSSETAIGWDWDKNPDWKRFNKTSGIPAPTLPALVKEHHKLRDLQNEDSEASEGSKVKTTGLFDLMKWTGWKYRNTSSFRVYLSNQNVTIIKTYNKGCGKPDPGGKLGAFGKFSQEKQDEYLLKGLGVSSYYRKPRESKNNSLGISAADESQLFNMLFK